MAKGTAHEAIKAVKMLEAAALAAAANSTAVDTNGFEELMIYADIGTITDGGYVFTVEESSDSSSFSTVSGTASAEKDSSDDNDELVWRLNLRDRERYIRIAITEPTGGTTGGVFSIVGMLTMAHSAPVSQAASVTVVAQLVLRDCSGPASAGSGRMRVPTRRKSTMPKYTVQPGCSFHGYAAGTVLDINAIEAKPWVTKGVLAEVAKADDDGAKPQEVPTTAKAEPQTTAEIADAMPEPDNSDPGDEADPEPADQDAETLVLGMDDEAFEEQGELTPEDDEPWI